MDRNYDNIIYIAPSGFSLGAIVVIPIFFNFIFGIVYKIHNYAKKGLIGQKTLEMSFCL